MANRDVIFLIVTGVSIFAQDRRPLNSRVEERKAEQGFSPHLVWVLCGARVRVAWYSFSKAVTTEGMHILILYLLPSGAVDAGQNSCHSGAWCITPAQRAQVTEPRCERYAFWIGSVPGMAGAFF